MHSSPWVGTSNLTQYSPCIPKGSVFLMLTLHWINQPGPKVPLKLAPKNTAKITADLQLLTGQKAERWKAQKLREKNAHFEMEPTDFSGGAPLFLEAFPDQGQLWARTEGNHRIIEGFVLEGTLKRPHPGPQGVQKKSLENTPSTLQWISSRILIITTVTRCGLWNYGRQFLNHLLAELKKVRISEKEFKAHFCYRIPMWSCRAIFRQ